MNMLPSKLVPGFIPRVIALFTQNVRFLGCATSRNDSSIFSRIVKSNTAILPTLIEPPSNIKPSYETPTLQMKIEKHIFGVPMTIPPEIREPKMDKPSLIDPAVAQKTKIEAHKRDLYWRRRGMKHHRYLRWRKRNETMLATRETARQLKREKRKAAELEDIWKSAGLRNEPPAFCELEEKSKVSKWRELGIWNGALTTEEIFELATPADPPNKKTYTPPSFNIPR